jgi:hypothetical protein
MLHNFSDAEGETPTEAVKPVQRFIHSDGYPGPALNYIAKFRGEELF